uniref:Chitin-binding type-2 domain-containing protein n=1 Tax=Strigamia maritima TaxID=126957 RepID=T1J4L6_STRMM
MAGYYADPHFGCQVYHKCDIDYRKDSFLCSNGTLFNQKTFVCEWWYSVDCSQSVYYYELNARLYKKKYSTFPSLYQDSRGLVYMLSSPVSIMDPSPKPEMSHQYYAKPSGDVLFETFFKDVQHLGSASILPSSVQMPVKQVYQVDNSPIRDYGSDEYPNAPSEEDNSAAQFESQHVNKPKRVKIYKAQQMSHDGKVKVQPVEDSKESYEENQKHRKKCLSTLLVRIFPHFNPFLSLFYTFIAILVISCAVDAASVSKKTKFSFLVSDFNSSDISGSPGKDYPTFRDIPETNFVCDGLPPGIYADYDTRCQVCLCWFFHMCDEKNVKLTFLCPNGSVFNEKRLKCDLWSRVPCKSAHSLVNLLFPIKSGAKGKSLPRNGQVVAQDRTLDLVDTISDLIKGSRRRAQEDFDDEESGGSRFREIMRKILKIITTGFNYGDDGSYGDYSAIPGTPGQDYPLYGPHPPVTNFQCQQQQWIPGYYADTQFNCQVYHVCESEKDNVFLCPNGTVFNQLYFVCDWWYNVDCSQSVNWYSLNGNLYGQSESATNYGNRVAVALAEDKSESRSAEYPNEDTENNFKFPGKSSSSYRPHPSKPTQIIHPPESTPSDIPSYLLQTQRPLRIPNIKPISAPHPNIPQQLIHPGFPQRPFPVPPPQQQNLLPQTQFPHFDQTETQSPHGSILFPHQQQRPQQRPTLYPNFPITPQRPQFPPQKPIEPHYPFPPQRPTTDPHLPLPPLRPINPQYPNVPKKPINPQYPIVPQKPINPQYPIVPQKPINPQYPIVPQKPINPHIPYPDEEYDLSHSIPGHAGKDYPIYAVIPRSEFQCDGNYPGFYADMHSGCQVWHYCQLDARLDSFLCPNGTIFNQKYFVCDWWYNVDCESSQHYYPLNSNLYREPPYQQDGAHYPRPAGSVTQEHQDQDQVSYRKSPIQDTQGLRLATPCTAAKPLRIIMQMPTGWKWLLFVTFLTGFNWVTHSTPTAIRLRDKLMDIKQDRMLHVPQHRPRPKIKRKTVHHTIIALLYDDKKAPQTPYGPQYPQPIPSMMQSSKYPGPHPMTYPGLRSSRYPGPHPIRYPGPPPVYKPPRDYHYPKPHRRPMMNHKPPAVQNPPTSALHTLPHKPAFSSHTETLAMHQIAGNYHQPHLQPFDAHPTNFYKPPRKEHQYKNKPESHYQGKHQSVKPEPDYVKKLHPVVKKPHPMDPRPHYVEKPHPMDPRPHYVEKPHPMDIRPHYVEKPYPMDLGPHYEESSSSEENIKPGKYPEVYLDESRLHRYRRPFEESLGIHGYKSHNDFDLIQVKSPFDHHMENLPLYNSGPFPSASKPSFAAENHQWNFNGYNKVPIRQPIRNYQHMGPMYPYEGSRSMQYFAKPIPEYRPPKEHQIKSYMSRRPQASGHPHSMDHHAMPNDHPRSDEEDDIDSLVLPDKPHKKPYPEHIEDSHHLEELHPELHGPRKPNHPREEHDELQSHHSHHRPHNFEENHENHRPIHPEEHHEPPQRPHHIDNHHQPTHLIEHHEPSHGPHRPHHIEDHHEPPHRPQHTEEHHEPPHRPQHTEEHHEPPHRHQEHHEPPHIPQEHHEPPQRPLHIEEHHEPPQRPLHIEEHHEPPQRPPHIEENHEPLHRPQEHHQPPHRPQEHHEPPHRPQEHHEPPHRPQHMEEHHEPPHRPQHMEEHHEPPHRPQHMEEHHEPPHRPQHTEEHHEPPHRPQHMEEHHEPPHRPQHMEEHHKPPHHIEHHEPPFGLHHTENDHKPSPRPHHIKDHRPLQRPHHPDELPPHRPHKNPIDHQYKRPVIHHDEYQEPEAHASLQHEKPFLTHDQKNFPSVPLLPMHEEFKHQQQEVHIPDVSFPIPSLSLDGPREHHHSLSLHDPFYDMHHVPSPHKSPMTNHHEMHHIPQFHMHPHPSLHEHEKPHQRPMMNHKPPAVQNPPTSTLHTLPHKPAYSSHTETLAMHQSAGNYHQPHLQPFDDHPTNFYKPPHKEHPYKDKPESHYQGKPHPVKPEPDYVKKPHPMDLRPHYVEKPHPMDLRPHYVEKPHLLDLGPHYEETSSSTNQHEMHHLMPHHIPQFHMHPHPSLHEHEKPISNNQIPMQFPSQHDQPPPHYQHQQSEMKPQDIHIKPDLPNEMQMPKPNEDPPEHVKLPYSELMPDIKVVPLDPPHESNFKIHLLQHHEESESSFLTPMSSYQMHNLFSTLTPPSVDLLGQIQDQIQTESPNKDHEINIQPDRTQFIQQMHNQPVAQFHMEDTIDHPPSDIQIESQRLSFPVHHQKPMQMFPEEIEIHPLPSPPTLEHQEAI